MTVEPAPFVESHYVAAYEAANHVSLSTCSRCDGSEEFALGRVSRHTGEFIAETPYMTCDRCRGSGLMQQRSTSA